MPVAKHKLGQTFYIKSGRKSSDHLPIILHNGGPAGSLFYYDKVVRALGKDRTVVVYDQLGCGRSSKIATRHQTVATLAEDLHRLVKKLKIERFHLLGTSWGGSLALDYYFRFRGEGVASLILQSPLVPTKDWVRDANALLKTLPKRDQQIIAGCIDLGATDAKVYKASEAKFYKKFVGRKNTKSKRRTEYFKKYPNPHGEALYQHMWGPSEFSSTGAWALRDFGVISKCRHNSAMR